MESFKNATWKGDNDCEIFRPKKKPTHEERVEGAARLAVKLAAFNTPMGV